LAEGELERKKIGGIKLTDLRINNKINVGEIIILEDGRKLLTLEDDPLERYPCCLMDIETKKIIARYTDFDVISYEKYIYDEEGKELKIVEVIPAEKVKISFE